jgi:hypothetical protein
MELLRSWSSTVVGLPSILGRSASARIRVRVDLGMRVVNDAQAGILALDRNNAGPRYRNTHASKLILAC